MYILISAFAGVNQVICLLVNSCLYSWHGEVFIQNFRCINLIKFIPWYTWLSWSVITIGRQLRNQRAQEEKDANKESACKRVKIAAEVSTSRFTYISHHSRTQIIHKYYRTWVKFSSCSDLILPFILKWALILFVDIYCKVLELEEEKKRIPIYQAEHRDMIRQETSDRQRSNAHTVRVKKEAREK